MRPLLPGSCSMVALVTLVLLGWSFPCGTVELKQEGVVPQTSLNCFRSTDPDITAVDLLYKANSDVGHLWVKNGAVPACSSTIRPSPSRCSVCFQTFIFAVCSNVTQTLVMEGEGREVPILSSECPQLFDDTKAQVGAGNPQGRPAWWLLLLSFIISITTAR